MSVKMIVTDLDRTLLRHDKTLSPLTIGVFRRCLRHGIKVVFATARPKRTVEPLREGIPADALILHNGAVVCIGNRIAHHCGIETDEKNQIIAAILKENPAAELSVEIDDLLYANFEPPRDWNDVRPIRTDFSDLPALPADKIIVRVSFMEEMRRLERHLPNSFYLQMCEGKLGLIMHVDATKHSAMKRVARHWNIQLSETVAFGDDLNDMGMIQASHIGVATDNALDVVKEIADVVCGSCDRDGVARWLQENVL